MPRKNKNNGARNFFITINYKVIDKYDDYKAYLLERGCNYFVSSLEENKHGMLHIHIYVQFQEELRLSIIRMHGANIKICDGTEDQNIAYVRKYKYLFGVDNLIEEIGKVRYGINRNQYTMVTELQDVPFENVRVKDYNVWQQLQGFQSLDVREFYKPDVEVFYIWGDSGVGKTRKVFNLILQEEDKRCDRVKYINGYWHGVNVHQMPKIAWYDEFRSSSMPASEFINFIDYYANLMNVKYRTGIYNRYKKIYITSIEDPHSIYSNLVGEARQQWLRRLNIIHLETF